MKISETINSRFVSDGNFNVSLSGNSITIEKMKWNQEMGCHTSETSISMDYDMFSKIHDCVAKMKRVMKELDK